MNLNPSLNKKSHIITPNQRLAAECRDRFAKQQKKHSVWQSPTILPYRTWLTTQWNHLSIINADNNTRLITPLQEKLLWEKIITLATHHDPLLNVYAAAKQAMSANSTLARWEIPQDHRAFNSHENAQAYLQWAITAKQHHSEHDEITVDNIPPYLIKHAAMIRSQCDTLYWIGFTEFSPQQTHLIKALEHAGIACHCLPTIDQHTANPQRIALPNPETEILTMANWANTMAKAGHTVACVVPTLEQCRHTIDTIFNKCCDDNIVYNISAGKPLANYPLIHSALLILSLNRADIPLEKISLLLRSPFLGHAEIETRALFLIELQKLKQASFTLLEICQHLSRFNRCPDLLAGLTQFIESKTQEKQTHREWANTFITQLSALQWPGERTLNSDEFQLHTRFATLWHEFTGINFQQTPISLSEALRHLNHLCADTVFQSQQTQLAQIHILGLLEAAGIPFEKMWVMGMNDKTLPAAAKPNPFIPYHLQQALAMPHADANKEFHFARKIMDQLLTGNASLIASYAMQDGDQSFNQSPLIADYPLCTLSSLGVTLHELTQYDPITLEETLDDAAPPVTQDETIKGGTSIIKRQATCPFQAFATVRLKAHAIDEPEIGLSAMKKGIILHHALETLFTEIDSQKNLLAMEETIVNKKIIDHIDRAITLTLTKGFIQKNSALINIEKKRCHLILQAWLQIEKERPPFSVIAVEKEQQLSLSGLSMTLRIDRIDRLENGTLMIIDYKTVLQNEQSWFGSRPTEPQLPLYCINNDNVGSLAIGQLNKKELTYKGITQTLLKEDSRKTYKLKTLDKLKLDLTSNTWSDQLTTWRNDLTQLAKQFMQGRALIDPIDTTACEHCHLMTLCRVHDKGAHR